MKRYTDRLMDARLAALLAELPAIVLTGPKAVGKTSTARRVAGAEFALDEGVVREALTAEPDRIRAAAPPVLLDEWQRLPETWDWVRRWVDQGAAPGSFLLTGSAYPRGAAIHSGAGRIVTVRMRPMSLVERGVATPSVSLAALLGGVPGDAAIAGDTPKRLSDYVAEIIASGLPQVRGLSPVARTLQLDGYLDAVIYREFPEQGLMVRAPGTLRRWLSAYAAATGTTASYTKILDGATVGDAAKPAKTTTIAYRDVLNSLFLLDPVPAWNPPIPELGRLSQAPKHFLADPALAARLLDIDDDDLLSGEAETVPVARSTGAGYGTLLGRLFEALIAQSLYVYADMCGARLHHLRTRNGDHEVDFLLVRRQKVLAVGVKLSPTVDDADIAHLTWLRSRLGARLADAVVVTTGPTAYRRKDGIAVVPAALLGA